MIGSCLAMLHAAQLKYFLLHLGCKGSSSVGDDTGFTVSEDYVIHKEKSHFVGCGMWYSFRLDVAC